MRLNRFIANATGMSRRAADQAIEQGSVSVDGRTAEKGQDLASDAVVTLNGKALSLPKRHTTIMLNKPAGYIVSREGQGSKTIYELLPPDLQRLKPVGRLDKDSSGLLLLTDDGALAQELTHPKHQKEKSYEVELNKPLSHSDKTKIEQGITLDDGVSSFKLEPTSPGQHNWRVTMHEGRNRQIRRTFGALGCEVTKLHRTRFGKYSLPRNLHSGNYRSITTAPTQ